MHRNFYIAVALATFSIGFLIADSIENFFIAFPIALVVFILFNKVSNLNFTFHHLKVALLTLIIWIPFAAVVLNALPKAGSCVIDLPQEEIESLKEAGKNEGVIVTTEPMIGVDYAVSECTRWKINDVTSNTIWAGVVDNKVIIKPAPVYPPHAKSADIHSIVAVAVVIDPTGKVIEAEAISGHPLLRQAAVEAAYKARFEPSKICGIPPDVTGILTYRFGL